MIIAFSGKRGVGKTTASMYLSNQYGFQIVSFGAALKKKALEFFPFTYDELYGNKKEKPFSIYEWSPRDFMIALGNLARYFDKDYWIKAAIPTSTRKHTAIDDCRYLNETTFLKEKGAKIIRIERYKKDNPYKTVIHDPSEEELDDYKGFDFTINEVENSSLTMLYQKLDLIMSELGIEKK